MSVGIEQTVKDDVVVVHDEVVNEEKIHEDLVADVTKLLNKSANAEGDKTPEPNTKPGDTPEMPGKPEVAAKEGEGAKGADESESLSQGLVSRAKGAGLTEDLTQRLHQAGQLEETLAAFDRSMIEHVQSREAKTVVDPKGQAKEPPKADDQGLAEAEIPALDPDVYDEELVKRDAYQQQRIDALEARLEELLEGQQSGFDDWFDGALAELGLDTNDEEKCQTVFKAFGAMCDAFGKNPTARDKAMVARAHAAMYPQDVFKQQQQKTVDRLRDAEGKFLSSPSSKGAPPPKGATDEEVHANLVSNVDAYLKKRGVQMSGY